MLDLNLYKITRLHKAEELSSTLKTKILGSSQNVTAVDSVTPSRLS